MGKAKELPRTTELQVEAFLDGRKPSVLFMNYDAARYLPFYDRYDTGQGELVYSDEKYLEYAKNDKLGLALGYGIENKPGKGCKCLSAYTKEGELIVDIMTDGRKEVEEAAKKIAGDGYIEYRSANEVIDERRRYWR